MEMKVRNLSIEDMQERINELRDLNEELASIVSRISFICDEIGDENARRYLVAHLEIAVETGGWQSYDLTLPQWIDRLERKLDGDEDDEEFDDDYYEGLED